MTLASPTINRMQSPAVFDPYHKWLGIPPTEQPPTYYRLLGLSPLEQDPDVIDNAADGRMAMLRSVQGGPHFRLSQELQSEIAKARTCLLNPEFKRRYDAAIVGEVAAVPSLAEKMEAPPAVEMPAKSSLEIDQHRPAPRPSRFRMRRPSARRWAKRRPDNPFILAVKIIGGGIVGLMIGYYIAFLVAGFDPLEVMTITR